MKAVMVTIELEAKIIVPELVELFVIVVGTESTVTVGTTVTVAGCVAVGVVWVRELGRMVTGPRISDVWPQH